jgi:competence protein ComEC
MILFCLLLLAPITITPDTPDYFAVWNVGQGSAASLITTTECIHIDWGGETFPTDVVNHCRKKQNRLFLTHFDWDHINFVSLSFKFDHFCVATPLPLKLSAKKRALFKNIIFCQKTKNPSPQNLPLLAAHSRHRFANESSIYYLKNILITGDAPKKQEHQLQLSFAHRAQILLLGHHGSRTSTSEKLLSQLPNLKLSIANARKKRYGHPHQDVLTRLKKAYVPLLTTEDLGHIFFEQK